jgi:hypothetical protein
MAPGQPSRLTEAQPSPVTRESRVGLSPVRIRPLAALGSGRLAHFKFGPPRIRPLLRESPRARPGYLFAVPGVQGHAGCPPRVPSRVA